MCLARTCTCTPVASATACDIPAARLSSSTDLDMNKQSCKGGPIGMCSRAAVCILASSPRASSCCNKYDFQHLLGSLGTSTCSNLVGFPALGTRSVLVGKRSAMSWTASRPEPVAANSRVTSDVVRCRDKTKMWSAQSIPWVRCHSLGEPPFETLCRSVLISFSRSSASK